LARHFLLSAAALRARGVEVAIGNFSDIDSLRAALEGVAAAYFLYPIAPGIIDATAYFAQASKEAGVTAIVNMSQISARREARSHAAQDHWIAERIFGWSGIATTHLRPTFFAEWLSDPYFAKEISARKRIEFPFANARHAPIAAEDQGRLVGFMLADPAPHAGQIYTLHGPVEMDHNKIARAMSEALGTEISYSPIEIEEFRRKMEDLSLPSVSSAASGGGIAGLSRRRLRRNQRCHRAHHGRTADDRPDLHQPASRRVRLTRVYSAGARTGIDGGTSSFGR
jgi:NAD(P)H dehydrogenase (quinone)